MTTHTITIPDAHRLKRALLVLGAAVDRRSHLPELRGVELTTRPDGHLGVRTNDLSMELAAHVPAEVTLTTNDALRFLVPFQSLKAMLARVAKPTATREPVPLVVEYDDIDRTVQYTLGAWTRRVEDPDYERPLPDVSRAEAVGGVEYDCGTMADVARFASPDYARPILACVKVESGTLVATDSYRLASTVAPEIHEDTMPKRDLLIPRHAAMIVAKLPGTFILSWNDRTAFLTHPDVTIAVRRVEGEFPNWRGVTTSLDKPGGAITCMLDDMRDALRCFQPGDHINPIKVDMSQGKLRVRRKSSPDGASDLVRVTGTSTIEGIAFNATYLLDVLDRLDGPVLVINAIDAQKPAAITDGTRTRVIMPVRVS